MTPTLWSEFWSPGTSTIEAIGRVSVRFLAPQLRSIEVGTGTGVSSRSRDSLRVVGDIFTVRRWPLRRRDSLLPDLLKAFCCWVPLLRGKGFATQSRGSTEDVLAVLFTFATVIASPRYSAWSVEGTQLGMIPAVRMPILAKFIGAMMASSFHRCCAEASLTSKPRSS